MDSATPLHTAEFFRDGRGPELRRAHWSEAGTTLLAIDYYNPTDPYDAAHLRHVRFLKPQVVMITPEEVTQDGLGGLPSGHGPAAMFDLGRSSWLSSFAPQHLTNCHHFRLLFYDEIFDVIAEGAEVGLGGFGHEAV